jgi:peptidoglycan/xylan/chitin deacetylase (PgdA/CDA1 family)
LTALLLASVAIPHPLELERAVAVTFDDLPATPAGVVANNVSRLEALTRKLLSAVQRYGVPAVGFVHDLPDQNPYTAAACRMVSNT